MKKHKSGFTLAEVLITLVIIGIIAAMTIPTLMNKTNEQETVVAVKKAYSTLGQAYQRMIAENGELNPSYFGSSSEVATKTFADMFVKYLNVQKICGQESGMDCWSTENGGMYKNFVGSDWYNWNLHPDKNYTVMLSDGSSLSMYIFFSYFSHGDNEALSNILGYFYVDVNGYKGPNTLGKDVFSFWVSKYGVVPVGTPNDTTYPLSTCRSIGSACTAWVITKGNMDYLRKDVSW